MKKLFHRAGLLLMCTAMIGMAMKPAEKKVSLRMNLEKGKVYNTEIDNKQDISQTIMGQESNSKTETYFGSRMEVLDVNKQGDQTVKLTYTKVIFDMGTMSYNSDKNDTDNVFSKMMSAFKGASLNMIISRTGEVKQLTGVDKIMDQMIAKAGSMMPAAQLTLLRQNLEQSFSNEKMKQNMNQSYNMYPDKEVGVGDTWQKEQDMESVVPLHVMDTYKVKEIKAESVVLERNSTISTGDKPAANGTSSKLTGTQSGTMEVSRKTGLPMHTSITQDIGGSISMQNPMGGGDMMDIPIKMKSVTTGSSK